MSTMFTYHFKATAPGHEKIALCVDAVSLEDAESDAREEAADLLGVRAEHVALACVLQQPNY